MVVLSLVNSRDYIDTLNAYIATPPREVGGVYFRWGGGGGLKNDMGISLSSMKLI